MICRTMTTQLNCLQEEVLKQLSKSISSQQRLSEIQELCFLLRFNPQFKDLTHANIASRINKKQEGDFQEEGINRTVSAVAKKVCRTFKTEMITDGVELNSIESEGSRKAGSPGNHSSPYKLVYDWIWSKKFPRVAWELSKDVIAQWADQQIQMIPIAKERIEGRGFSFDEIPDNDLNIQLGERYRLQVNLGMKGNLLLINEDKNGHKALICPSKAFAPSSQLSPTEAMYLPPDEDNRYRARSFRFEEEGEEYFLAIVTEQPLELSWIKPDLDPKDIYLNPIRLKEIFTKIGKQGNSRVFYKRFVVTA
ncbi:MAG: DUF4384 domain-containing protein [Cyanobacteria bacterium J06555_3]